MKLAYLTLEPTREGSASYTHVTEIIKGLQRRGWTIELYKPSYADKKQSPALLLRLLICVWLQVKMWLNWRRGQILYVRAHYLAFPSALIARIFGMPIIHEINGPYDDVFIAYPGLRKLRSILVWVQRKQYEWATESIAVTNELCKLIAVENKGKEVHHIPNAANTDLFHPDYQRPQNAPGKYVVFFGSMAKWHRIDVILQAFSNPVWPSDTNIVFIGDGPDKHLVDKAASQNPRIQSLGRMQPIDMPPYIASALCGLVTTGNVHSDTGSQTLGDRAGTGLYPLKLFETLACGVPAIVTDFPGQADLIRAGNCGLVIPHDDAEKLASAVAELASDPGAAKAMGMRAREMIVQGHSWDIRAAQTHDILMGVIDNKTA